MHGAPVHVGDPAALGIVDLARPDFGDAVTIEPDEIPVFWACGVTPQLALWLRRRNRDHAQPGLHVRHGLARSDSRFATRMSRSSMPTAASRRPVQLAASNFQR